MARRDLLGETRIDPARPKFRALFENLQGNILKSHGRDHAVLIFFRIKTGKAAAARRWIRAFASEYVTSARRQLKEARSHKHAGTFCSLLLSASGYRALGVPVPPDPRFRAGMKRSGAGLKDPPPRSWEPAYRRVVHGFVLLADDGPRRLGHLATAVRRQIGKFAEIATVERGQQLYKGGHVVEHFGYVDGPSQPRFFKADILEQETEQNGIDTWDPSAPLRLVLTRDPNTQAADAFGSYLVFRKLEQNARAFSERTDDMATTLTGSDDEAALAGAFMVGRFEDGTPVTRQPGPTTNDATGKKRKKATKPLVPPNNFTYADDPKGSRCPFQAHIRAANPRTQASRGQRIVRRGITYGTRRKSEGARAFSDLPREGVGLLFMCLQRSIGDQFERMQKRINGQGGRPRDPAIGQGSGGATPLWPAPYATSSRMRYPPLPGGREERLVRLRGGEYFFVPSLPFLKQLQSVSDRAKAARARPGRPRRGRLPQTTL